jgi:hypothetical protein
MGQNVLNAMEDIIQLLDIEMTQGSEGMVGSYEVEYSQYNQHSTVSMKIILYECYHV